MSYAYPELLAEVIERRWPLAQLNGLINAPLPPREHMLALIHAAFQASLLSEEGHPISFRLVLCHPNELDEDVEMRGRNRGVAFSAARPLNVSELVRLAPAADPAQTLVAVMPDDEGKLQIWGLIDAGLSWWEFVRGERGERLSNSPPPERFTVSSTWRGSVTVSRGGRVICRLHQGEITVPPPGEEGLVADFIGLHPKALRGLPAPNDVFTRGPFGAFLRPMTVAFQSEVLEQLGLDHYSANGHEEDYPTRFLLQFVERILIRIRDAQRGGTVLIVPEGWEHENSQIRDRLWIKFPTNDTDSWPALLRAIRIHREYDDLVLRAWDQPTVGRSEFRRVLMLGEELADAADLVRDRANLIASLARVDGAVVLSERLRVLGFGAEIVAHAPNLREVIVAEDAEATKIHRRPIEDFGTRHRSALRFCSTHDQVAALVVSQDGDLRAIVRDGPDVLMWPSIAANTRA